MSDGWVPPGLPLVPEVPRVNILGVRVCGCNLE